MESPVMVENFASIPIRVEHTSGGNYPPEPMEVDNSGFPFDEADFGRSDASFKSHLDDLAKRHPEIAQHFNKEFPFRSNTWGHKRRGSSSGKDEPKQSFPTDDFPDLKRFTDRPFGSRFERFGFPFNRTFDGEPHFRQEFQQPNNQQPSGSSQGQQQTSTSNQTHQQPSTSSNESQPSETRTQESFDKPPQVPNQDRGRKQHPYVQQSNTTDLGQKQEPVNDQRGQRSMSAPPENRSSHPRYVSSVKIPINVERGGDGMGSQQSQQQPQQQPQPNNQSQNQSTHERVIPIMVEGRDEPVIPRNVHPTFSSPPPKPEPERVFTGARPSQFAGWPRNESHFFRNEPYFQQPPSYQHHQQQQQHKPAEEPFKQQHVPPQQHTAAPSPQPQQQNRQPTPPKQEQAHSPTPPPAKPQGKLTPVEQIEAIQKDVADLMTQIENFTGKTKDKQYLYLDEMLTRNLIKLDDVQTDGQDELRQMRKEAIRSVQRCISVLESKVSSDKKQEEMDVEQNKNETDKPPAEQNMEVEKTEQQEDCTNKVKEQQNPSNQEQNKSSEELTALEVSGQARSGSEVRTNEDKKEGSPMDVNVESDAKPKTEENTDNKQETGDIKTEEKKEESAQDTNVEVKETKDKKEEKKDKKKVKKKEKSEKK